MDTTSRYLLYLQLPLHKREKQMKKKFIHILFLIQSFVIVSQTNYYVSPTGNNTNPGSLSLPWQSIQFGLNHLSAGDTLNLLTGIYLEKIYISQNNIVLRSCSGHSAVIDANGISTQDAVIAISNKTNIVIDNIEIKNNIQNNALGILIEGNSTNITIKNCVIHDIHFSSNPYAPVNSATNAQGIIVYGTHNTIPIKNIKILNNELYNCRLGYSEGIAINGNVDGFTIYGNKIHDLTNIGIDIIGHEGACSNPVYDQARHGLVKKNIVYNCISNYATSAGIYVDGGKSIIIENNISYHNGYGVEIGCENIGQSTDSVIVTSNVIYNNQVAALAIGGYAYPNGSGKVVNSVFRNNTCYNNDFSNSGNGELYLSYSENSIIENNIFYLSNQNIITYAELNQPGLYFNYNIFYSLNGPNSVIAYWNGNTISSFSSFQSQTHSNLNSSFANPIFIMPSITAPDFHLQSNSPAINAGNPSFTPSISETDMDGNMRCNGIVDCGAYEYYSNADVSTIFSHNTFYIYPNPSHDYFVINFSDHAPHSIKILSCIGQSIIELKTNKESSFIIDTSILNPGIYYCNIDNYQSIPLIKQ